MLLRELLKYNPHHGKDGRFSTADSNNPNDIAAEAAVSHIERHGFTHQTPFADLWNAAKPARKNISIGDLLKKLNANVIRTSPRSLYVDLHSQMVADISAFFTAQAEELIPKIVKLAATAKKTRISGLMRKITPDELADKIEFNGWESMAAISIMPAIESAFCDAGEWAAAKVIAAGADTELSVMVKMVNERAVDYAKTESAQLVTRIPDSTRAMIRDTVASSIKDGLGSYGLADRLATSNAFSQQRAALIASYELGQAAVSGNVAAWEASGVVAKKEWITSGDVIVSDGCSMNAAQGAIPMKQAFQSGHMHPLAHPHCRCDLVAVIKT